jgi:hypothetical protein
MHFTVCFSSAALSLETAWLKLHPDTNDSGQGRRNVFFHGAHENYGNTPLIITLIEIYYVGTPS